MTWQSCRIIVIPKILSRSYFNYFEAVGSDLVSSILDEKRLCKVGRVSTLLLIVKVFEAL